MDFVSWKGLVKASWSMAAMVVQEDGSRPVIEMDRYWSEKRVCLQVFQVDRILYITKKRRCQLISVD